MADKSAIKERLLVQQKSMFALAASKGFSQDLIYQWTKLPTTSLSEWACGKTKMSLVGLLAIAEIPDFPLELLSLLMPTGMAIVRVPAGIDHDEFERACINFIATKGAAHHPRSPAGRDIAPCEQQELDSKAAQLRAVAANG